MEAGKINIILSSCLCEQNQILKIIFMQLYPLVFNELRFPMEFVKSVPALFSVLMSIAGVPIVVAIIGVMINSLQGALDKNNVH